MKFNEKLKDINACNEAIEWVNGKGFKKSWNTCNRGDWMLWYISKNKSKFGLDDMRKITLAKGLCANLVIHLMKDKRSKKAVKVAIDYGNNKATKEQLYAAAAAAYAAADAAYYAAADAAAAAADYDADDDDAADAYAAADAAYYAAADYDADDDDAAARKKILSQCADICREVFKDTKLS